MKSSRAIVAATALLASLPALAQVSLPSQPAAGPTPSPESENGGLAFIGYDPVAGTSLFQYLGLNINQIAPTDLNQQSLDFGVLSGWQSSFASGTNFRWMVVAGDSVGYGGAPDFAGGQYDTLRLATTASANPAEQRNIGLETGLTNLNNFILTRINVPAGCNSGNPCTASTSSEFDYAGVLGANLNGLAGGAAALSFDTVGTIGSALGFYLFSGVGDAGAGDQAASLKTVYTGSWLLDSTGRLQWNATSVVPLPAAVWLLASGLVGMFTVARRRLTAAAV